MAIQAVLSKHEWRCHAVGQPISIGWHALVASLGMAALTQHRTAHLEHAGVIRAVRVVAVAAIFGDRCMFPEIRAALFGVAVKTGVV
jgi:hypothetical protein